MPPFNGLHRSAAPQMAPQARPEMPRQSAVFLDKDGTLVEDVPYNVDPARLRFTPQALEGLRLLAEHGHVLFVITNQPGLERGLFSRLDFSHLQAALTRLLRDEGIALRDVYVCPHAPAKGTGKPTCLCRKPSPALLQQAARTHRIDLSSSWMVGDILDDIEAGRRAGCRTVLLDVGHETEWLTSPMRQPHARALTLLEAAQAIVAAQPTPSFTASTTPLRPAPFPKEM